MCIFTFLPLQLPAAAATDSLCALQQLQSAALTSALYEWQLLNVPAEQKPAEQSRAGQDRDKCSAASGGTHARDSGAAPRKQLLCYQSHFDHRHGMKQARFLESFFMASECVLNDQIITMTELS